MGDVPNVVFPCAALVDRDADRLTIYYGGADTVVCMAHGHLSEMLAFVRGRKLQAGEAGGIASYSVNRRGVARAKQLIEARQYVLDSEWGDVQPTAADENAFLEKHSWDEYGEWHLGLTDGASEETKARYAFVFGDFRRVHRSGLIACALPRRRVAAQGGRARRPRAAAAPRPDECLSGPAPQYGTSSASQRNCINGAAARQMRAYSSTKPGATTSLSLSVAQPKKSFRFRSSANGCSASAQDGTR